MLTVELVRELVAELREAADHVATDAASRDETVARLRRLADELSTAIHGVEGQLRDSWPPTKPVP